MEDALQMPLAGEVVEWAAHDGARPFNGEALGGSVIGAAGATGEPRHRSVGFGRPLVEMLTLIGGGEGTKVTREVPSTVAADGGSRHVLPGLGILRIRGRGELGPEEVLGQGDLVVGAGPVRIEGAIGLRLVAHGRQSPVTARCE